MIPTKEAVREYLTLRANQRTPPPTLEQIRQQLGWKLIKNEKSR